MDIGGFSHGAFGVAGHADQEHLQTFQYRDQRQNLMGFAGVGNGDHDIVRGNHAQIAVAGLARMNEEGRRAGTGEGGGHFAADMAGFPHAHHHHLPRQWNIFRRPG